MKKIQVASVLLALGTLASSPASATTCTADLVSVKGSTTWITIGYTDAPAVSYLTVLDAKGQPRQVIQNSNYGQFAAVVTFPVNANEVLTGVFVDKFNQVICVDSLAPIAKVLSPPAAAAEDGADADERSRDGEDAASGD